MFFQKRADKAWDEISDSLASVAGDAGKITGKHQLSGGSINSAFCVETEHGDTFFVKLNREDLLPMFEAEAEGLQELRKADAVRVPAPLCFGAGEEYSWIVTEFIFFTRKAMQTETMFGHQFARMHRYSANCFGWHRDNTIGSNPQMNEQEDSWIDFYRKHRLGFQLELAASNGFKGALQSKGERLMADLSLFFDDYEPVASLLHGDLWGGNQGADERGNPVIFDPAVYYGDREADLAMTELFGGFSARFYDAYRESWPLHDGYAVRKTLYNLYHILNHANLFGGGYAMQAEGMMDQLLAEL